jgi:hypothetical protein
MVLAGISPLFILWAIKGSCLIPDIILIPACILLCVAPNLVLLARLKIARHQDDTRVVVVGRCEDIRSHLLLYLFAMLLPLYALDLTTWRTFAAALAAVVFVTVIFYLFNLHYMNIVFAILSYRVYTIYPPEDGNKLSGKRPIVLITRRDFLNVDDRILAYRLSDSVLMEIA